MAKKRRVVAEKEPEYEFVPPDFDEKEFILKDIYGTKITLAVAAFAVIIGLIAGLLDRSFEYYVGLILMFAGMFILKYFLKLIRLDPDLLVAGKDTGGSKSMLGNYFVYLFLTLAIWIFMINPPMC